MRHVYHKRYLIHIVIISIKLKYIVRRTRGVTGGGEYISGSRMGWGEQVLAGRSPSGQGSGCPAHQGLASAPENI